MTLNSEELLFSNQTSEFLASLNNVRTISEAQNVTNQALQRLGIETFSLTIDLGSPSPVMVHHLPGAIANRFLQEIVPAGIDPLLRCCENSQTPKFGGKAFSKSLRIGSRALANWLDELNSAGIKSALTIPVHSSFAGNWGVIHFGCDLTAGEFRKLMAAHGAAAILMSVHAYNHIRELKNLDSHSDGVLTPRERECLLWIAKGERNDSIAHRLKVARATVDFHISNARRKLNTRTREQAIAIAVKQGLITP